eukprot:gene56647-75642_t
MTKNDNPLSRTDEEVRAILKESRENEATNTPEDLKRFAQLDNELMKSLKSKRSYISLLSEQFMQAIDDYQLSQKVKEVQNIAKSNLTSTLTLLKPVGKPKMVILGTGWGVYAFLKTIDATMYDIVVVSPRNYFLFTPMLAASAVGTVEFRSITEPIRNVNPLVDYLEAQATSIDNDKKIVSCQSVKCEVNTDFI